MHCCDEFSDLSSADGVLCDVIAHDGGDQVGIGFASTAFLGHLLPRIIL